MVIIALMSIGVIVSHANGDLSLNAKHIKHEKREKLDLNDDLVLVDLIGEFDPPWKHTDRPCWRLYRSKNKCLLTLSSQNYIYRALIINGSNLDVYCLNEKEPDKKTMRFGGTDFQIERKNEYGLPIE